MRKIFSSEIKDVGSIIVDIEVNDETLETLEQIDIVLDLLNEAQDFLNMAGKRARIDRDKITGSGKDLNELGRLLKD